MIENNITLEECLFEDHFLIFQSPAEYQQFIDCDNGIPTTNEQDEFSVATTSGADVISSEEIEDDEEDIEPEEIKITDLINYLDKFKRFAVNINNQQVSEEIFKKLNDLERLVSCQRSFSQQKLRHYFNKH